MSSLKKKSTKFLQRILLENYLIIMIRRKKFQNLYLLKPSSVTSFLHKSLYGMIGWLVEALPILFRSHLNYTHHRQVFFMEIIGRDLEISVQGELFNMWMYSVTSCCGEDESGWADMVSSWAGMELTLVLLLLLLLLSRFSRVRLCATPQMAAHQAPLSLGFSRQEHWSGLPFPSPMHESEVAQ